jgi:hypothetical protein
MLLKSLLRLVSPGIFSPFLAHRSVSRPGVLPISACGAALLELHVFEAAGRTYPKLPGTQVGLGPVRRVGLSSVVHPPDHNSGMSHILPIRVSTCQIGSESTLGMKLTSSSPCRKRRSVAPLGRNGVLPERAVTLPGRRSYGRCSASGPSGAAFLLRSSPAEGLAVESRRKCTFSSW